MISYNNSRNQQQYTAANCRSCLNGEGLQQRRRIFLPGGKNFQPPGLVFWSKAALQS